MASKAGATAHPAWYHNLVAHPDVEVEIDGERRPVRCARGAGRRARRLWRSSTTIYNGYEIYAERAGARQIPVMVLEPR